MTMTTTTTTTRTRMITEVQIVVSRQFQNFAMFRRRLTHRIDVKESARRPRDAFEHFVMERHRGSHAEDE